jgi:L-threonylcarbamoyladenylate synthase
MRLFIKEEVELNKERILRILENSIFIYPTDTIYGLGCNALREDLVEKIRLIKQRPEQPFSVIAPSKAWIYKNCNVSRQGSKWVKKLPGPYTLIMNLKNPNAVAENVNNNLPTVGVRIPKHWFTEIVSELNIPIVTTSANITGGNFMTSLDDLDEEIKRKVEYAIYEGPKKGKPSELIDLTKIRIQRKGR